MSKPARIWRLNERTNPTIFVAPVICPRWLHDRLNLLSIPNEELACAMFDAYCEKRWGIRPLKTTTEIPVELVNHNSSEELFFTISDLLKASINES